MIRVLLLMFDEVELLDFAGPYEVLTTANRMADRLAAGEAPLVDGRSRPLQLPRFELVTASPDGKPVQARAGLPLQPQYRLVDAPACDWLLVPGGVVGALLADAPLLVELQRRAGAASCVASICTGALVLAAAGVLQHCEATTHWEDLADLARLQPDLTLRPDLRWVDTGRVLTSAGIAAGIDLSLHLVRRAGDAALAGLGPDSAGTVWARRTARQLDTPWRDDPLLS
ncbi:DJ-1/PfpI family protein [Ideonella azotifigens]|uniref:DJ-1/PfpI family protein n=1 Tax=Ideonella azotifigens TaxID=513160 RepID=A0ABN1K5S7_9BURK|nr:DJ-1/PfpI family protein [Ideonella azotifigens]MCD2342451.1 DJ-1/PfpI family protein [Ideonella azotifigens]